MKITIDKAIEKMTLLYETARKDSMIQKPLSYALYKTWRYVDQKEQIKGKNNENT